MIDIDKIRRNINKMIDMGAPEKDIDDYIASEGVTINEFKTTPKPMPAKIDIAPDKEDMSWGTVGRQAVSNIPSSAVEFGKNIVTPIIHPIETGKGLYTIAKGGIGKLRAGEQPEEQAFDALTEFFKQRYGGIENIKRTIATDPVGFAADLSTLLTGVGGIAKHAGRLGQISKLAKTGGFISKAGAYIDPLTASTKAIRPIARPVVRQAGELGKEILGKTTGAGREAIEQAWKGGNIFRTALRKKIPQEEILQSAQDALETIKIERANTYRPRLEEIGKLKTTLDISPVQHKLKQLMDSFNIKVTQNGLDFLRSTLDRKSIGDVEDIINTVASWGTKKGDRTPIGLDILKRRLDDFYSESKNSRAMVTSLRNEVKNILVREVPEYAKMTGDYAKTTEIIKEIERALSLNKRAAADTALRKLMSTMRENFEFRKQLVQQLESLGKESDISEKIAGVTMQPLIPRGLLGPIGASGIVLTGILADPKIFSLLTLSSPRLIGEFTNLLGRTSRELAKTGKYITPTRKVLFQAGRAAEQTKQQRPFGELKDILHIK